MRSKPAKRRVDWSYKGWRVRFKKQDEPGITSRLLCNEMGNFLVDHGGHGNTRVREISFRDESPRRSEPIGRHLRAAEIVGGVFAILTEDQLCWFDPMRFEATSLIPLPRPTDGLTVSPTGSRCYVGSSRFSMVVDGDRGVTTTLEAVSLPRMTIKVDALEGARDTELWIHPSERLLRIVNFDDDGRAEIQRVEEAADLKGIAAFLRQEKWVFILSADGAPDPFPFPGELTDSSLVKLRFGPAGSERAAAESHTDVIDVLGFDAEGSLVTLEAPGKTHVVLRDRETLKKQASKAFRKFGSFELAGMPTSSSVLAFRRWEKLDRAYVMTWADQALPEEVHIADARTIEER